MTPRDPQKDFAASFMDDYFAEAEEHLVAVRRQLLTIESALGLRRKKGRPKADERLRIEMAAEVLRQRLAGVSHQEALEEVSCVFGWGTTTVGEAWANHKFGALECLLVERRLEQAKNHSAPILLDGNPWTEEEKDRMVKMFKKREEAKK